MVYFQNIQRTNYIYIQFLSKARDEIMDGCDPLNINPSRYYSFKF